MIKEATAMMVRQNLGELLNGIQYGHDQIVITKAGKPVAAMVDAELFEKIRLMKHEFNRMTDQLAAAYAGAETEAQDDIGEALAAVRQR